MRWGMMTQKNNPQSTEEGGRGEGRRRVMGRQTHIKHLLERVRRASIMIVPPTFMFCCVLLSSDG